MSRSTIHLVNPFAKAFGGSERRALDTHQEAVGYLEALRSDPVLAQRVGQAARATVVDRLRHAHIARVREFFLQPAGRPKDS